MPHQPHPPSSSQAEPSTTQLRIMELEEHLSILEPQVNNIIADLPLEQREILEDFFSANTERELHIMKQAFQAGQRDGARRQRFSMKPLFL